MSPGTGFPPSSRMAPLVPVGSLETLWEVVRAARDREVVLQELLMEERGSLSQVLIQLGVEPAEVGHQTPQGRSDT